MKKHLFVALIITLFMLGCEKKQANCKETNEKQVSGKQVDTAFARQFESWSKDEQLTWLNKNKQDICDSELYELVLGFHKIDDMTFAGLAINFWGTADKVEYLPITWKKINTLTKQYCYEKYLSFDYDEKLKSVDDIKLKTNTFTVKPTSYSIPLLRGVNEFYDLDDDSVLLFTKAKKATGEIGIIFKIKAKSGDFYFDISDDPRFTMF